MDYIGTDRHSMDNFFFAHFLGGMGEREQQHKEVKKKKKIFSTNFTERNDILAASSSSPSFFQCAKLSFARSLSHVYVRTYVHRVQGTKRRRATVLNC